MFPSGVVSRLLPHVGQRSSRETRTRDANVDVDVDVDVRRGTSSCRVISQQACNWARISSTILVFVVEGLPQLLWIGSRALVTRFSGDGHAPKPGSALKFEASGRSRQSAQWN